MTIPSTSPAFPSGQVSVSIDSAESHANPSGWRLGYSVHNTSQAGAWLVVEESLRFKCDGSQIELSYARAKLRAGVKVFGYFDPQVVALPSGANLRQSVEITWPCRLSDLWNSEPEAAPAPGNYQVSIRVGFAPTAAPEAPREGESVEASVLRWQHEAVSPPVSIRVLSDARGGALRPREQKN